MPATPRKPESAADCLRRLAAKRQAEALALPRPSWLHVRGPNVRARQRRPGGRNG